MKKPVVYLFILTVCFFLVRLRAQQLPQYSQYMFNQIAYNPGFAGATPGICAGGLIRQQWVGFKEKDSEGNSYKVAPETYLVSINAPVKALHGGLAGTIIQDKLGFQKDIFVNLIYGYQTMLGSGDLGIGVQLSILNKSIDFNKLEPPDDKTSDPVLQNRAEESDIYFDGGVGLYYSLPDNYYLGLSILQIRQASKKDGTGYQLKRQYNFTGGYELTLPNAPTIDILPSVMIKSDGTSVQYDLSGLIRFNNKFWGGLSYRFQDAAAIILGMHYQDFTIGYSYDIPTSAIGSFGSHEIRISYCFRLELDKFRQIYRNTRFL